MSDPLLAVVSKFHSREKTRNHTSLKAGFHWLRSQSRSRNQKRRAYDLVKTAFRFRLLLRRLRSAYDLVKTSLKNVKFTCLVYIFCQTDNVA